MGRVWLDYARFAQDRDKLRTAQKIYLRALVGDATTPASVVDEQDRNLLWNEFLEMMKQTQPELTMAALKRAVEEEHIQSISATQDVLMDRTSPDLVTSTTRETSSPQTMERPEKRQRIVGNSPLPPTETKTHVVTAESVSTEAVDLLGLIQGGMPPEISATWFVRDGDSPPSPPEPALFSSSPPKLTDPTGKEILGTKLALAVITRLLKKDDKDSSGSILLEVCRGLWMLSALTEKKAADKIDAVDKSIVSTLLLLCLCERLGYNTPLTCILMQTTQMEELDASLETRLSVAGAASSAVQQLNDNERNAFQQSCYQRRQEALNSIAWDFRNVSLVIIAREYFRSFLTLVVVCHHLAPVHSATSVDEITGSWF